MLQEYVQCSKQFHAPQHRPILQWSFDTRVDAYAVPEFRATVSFVLDGVLHHSAGGWHASKKQAQRDAAERALGFFVGSWGEFLLSLKAGQDAAPEDAGPAGASQDVGLEDASPDEAEEALERFCREAPVCAGGGPPRWSTSWRGRQCVATIRLSLLGVPHAFSGAPQPSTWAARLDATQRLLWYLRCPGFDEAFEPDPYACAAAAPEVPAPPPNWVECSAKEEEDGSARGAAARKAAPALLRAQGCQQAFAQRAWPGQGAREWSSSFHEGGWERPPTRWAAVRGSFAGA